MPLYEFKCECGKTFDVHCSMGDASSEATCACGRVAKRVWTSPRLNFWSVDPREMNGEKEAIDAGMYE